MLKREYVLLGPISRFTLWIYLSKRNFFVDDYEKRPIARLNNITNNGIIAMSIFLEE